MLEIATLSKHYNPPFLPGIESHLNYWDSVIQKKMDRLDSKFSWHKKLSQSRFFVVILGNRSFTHKSIKKPNIRLGLSHSFSSLDPKERLKIAKKASLVRNSKIRDFSRRMVTLPSPYRRRSTRISSCQTNLWYQKCPPTCRAMTCCPVLSELSCRIWIGGLV